MKSYRDDILYHHGVKGMRWGVRRYQNYDGTLTPAGAKRYGRSVNSKKVGRRLKRDYNGYISKEGLMNGHRKWNKLIANVLDSRMEDFAKKKFDEAASQYRPFTKTEIEKAKTAALLEIPEVVEWTAFDKYWEYAESSYAQYFKDHPLTGSERADAQTWTKWAKHEQPELYKEYVGYAVDDIAEPVTNYDHGDGIPYISDYMPQEYRQQYEAFRQKYDLSRRSYYEPMESEAGKLVEKYLGLPLSSSMGQTAKQAILEEVDNKKRG